MTPRAVAMRSRQRRLSALVLLFALLAYGIALTGDYVFDDLHSVSANVALHDLHNFGSWWTDPGTFSAGISRMYRPVLLTSFGLNLWISNAPWALKAGNVLLHAAVAVMLFRWLWQLGRRSTAAFVVASLFAVHPMLSEAVNLVSARSELLGTAGMLLGLSCALTWQRRGGVASLCGIALGTVLACGSKETGVVLPVLVIAQAFCLRHRLPSSRQWRHTLVGLLPMLAVITLYLVARKLLLGEATVQLLGRTGNDPLDGGGRSLLVQLATMGTILPQALLQTVWPWPLSFDPQIHYQLSLLLPKVLLGWGSLMLLTVALLWPGPTARLRRIGVVSAWCVALPWILVPLNQPFAEHRVYGPFLGGALVWVVLWPRLRHLWRRLPRWLPHLVFAGALSVFALTSAQRSWLYRDERELWSAELAHNPQSFRSWWGLGTSRMRAGDLLGAVDALDRAHTLYPGHYDTLRNYVEALAMLPDAQAMPRRLLATVAELLELGPRDPWVRTLVAQAHLQAGRVLHDAEHFRQAEQVALSCLEIAEAKGYVFSLAAAARRGLGDPEGALRHLDDSLRRGLDSVRVRLDRAAVLQELGRVADARRELLRAQQMAPMDAMVMQALQQFAAPAK